MPCQKFVKFYCTCILTSTWTPIHINVHTIQTVFGQPCLMLLASWLEVTYNNYNKTIINEAFINNFFAITLQLLVIIIIISINITNNNNNSRLGYHNLT